jgi:NhaA family Na+:H+ antiporter
LVAAFVGQTAGKTNVRAEEALDGAPRGPTLTPSIEFGMSPVEPGVFLTRLRAVEHRVTTKRSFSMAEDHGENAPLPELPREPVHRWLEPFSRFLHIEAAGGVVLVICAATALVLANSPWAAEYLAFWKTPMSFAIGGFQVKGYLQHWINDGLMTLFFFTVGLEVKRELVLGELKEFRRATLPIAAAIGGMLLPAGIYFALQYGQSGARGWGIPMATDIAFVVGCMAILGPRVPRSLRVMLLSLAIVDDIGAILVIAVGYTESLNWTALALGFAGIGFVSALAKIGVRSVGVYLVLGILVWFAFHESGVHATISGVILGLMTPTRSWVSTPLLDKAMDAAQTVFNRPDFGDDEDDIEVFQYVEFASREAVSPLERLESQLHPWVSFAIMPIFALANAGVALELSCLLSPIAVAVMAGLVIGKPLGVFLFSWLAVKSRIASLPEGVTWSRLIGGGCLAGIGFTMAMFIASLAFKPQHMETMLNHAKIGVLFGSAVSAAIGAALLFAAAPKKRR